MSSFRKNVSKSLNPNKVNDNITFGFMKIFNEGILKLSVTPVYVLLTTNSHPNLMIE